MIVMGVIGVLEAIIIEIIDIFDIFIFFPARLNGLIARLKWTKKWNPIEEEAK
jgi:hypothetical protein